MTTFKTCPSGTFGTEYRKVTQNEACGPCPANVSICRCRSRRHCMLCSIGALLLWCWCSSHARWVDPVRTCHALTLSRHRPAVLQTISASAGATKCTKCGAGTWTGRLTGKNVCWPTSQKLPSRR